MRRRSRETVDRRTTVTAIESTQCTHPGFTHLTLPARCALTRDTSGTAPAVTVGGVAGQLGQVTLHVAERDARPSLLGVAEQVGGQQLDETRPHARHRP